MCRAGLDSELREAIRLRGYVETLTTHVDDLAVPITLDTPVNDGDRVDLMTLHIDPTQGLSPFVPVALNIGTASDIGVPLDGALPPLASVSVEVHYRVDVIPPA